MVDIGIGCFIHCNICQEVFTLSSDLIGHKCQRLIKVKKKAITWCDKCQKSFSSKVQYGRHMKYSHPLFSYTCGLCQKVQKTRNLLITHLKEAHSSSKQYSCCSCEKKFKTAATLKAHRNMYHSEDLVCKFCSVRGFRSKQEFYNHVRTKHTKERKFICKCGKSFMSSCVYYQHRKEHGAVNYSFKCLQCGKNFKRKCTLTRHQITHTDIWNYSCSLCKSIFRYKFDVKRHQKLIHGLTQPI